MSISKKIFWIFLSIIFIIFALGITMYVYQHGSKRMHNVLHALIDFNDSVYQLRELQINIITQEEDTSVYELQKRVEQLKSSSNMLSLSLNEMVNTSLNIRSLNSDIENYHKSINEFIENSLQYKVLTSDSMLYLSKLENFINSEYPQYNSKLNELEKLINMFVLKGSPHYIDDITNLNADLSIKVSTQSAKTLIKRLSLVLESMYVTRLNVIERKEYLDQSSRNFLEIAANLNDNIQKRDARLNKILSYSATSMSLISIVMALFYWIIINKYIKRFLKNQSDVMSAIKSRKIKNGIKPFSNDELGNLTHKMWEMAEELYDKDEELIASEKKYRAYINTTPLAVFVSDETRKILEVNPGTVAMLGYTEEELLGFTLDDIWAEDDIAENKGHFNLLAKDGNLNMIRRFNTKDNSLVYGNVSAIKIGTNKYVAFCQDITERIRLEKELKEVNENLIEQVRSEVDKNLKQDQIIQQQKKLADMGMMVSAIAHQWRQPLNALALCVQDVMEEYETGDMQKEYVSNFEDNSMKLIMHMSKTIDDFRDFFLPDKNVTEFNIINEITDLMRLLNVQIFSRDIDMVFTCFCEGGTIQCDSSNKDIRCVNNKNLVKGFPGEFKQVVINLIYNSVDAIADQMKLSKINRGKIDIKISCSLEKMIIDICDNGGGIDDNVFPHIFDPYYTTKDEGKGTGLGLYMSKVIIENHMDGKLFAKRPDLGTCMVIEFPIIYNQ